MIQPPLDRKTHLSE